jgi:para-nitrobenzyl esterase
MKFTFTKANLEGTGMYSRFSLWAAHRISAAHFPARVIGRSNMQAGFLTAVLLSLLAMSQTGCGNGGISPPPACVSTVTVVCTQSGQVQGTIEGDLRAFRGIPYAAPPVGNLRWRPPAPPLAWSGVRDATTFGNMCPQVDSNGQVIGNEDCLVLNIFMTASPPDTAQPVIVFFHGGNDTAGTTQKAKFDVPPLANHGVVVVTAEYRLGLLGFFANPLLTAEDGLSSGQYLLLDQIVALQWVHTNIAAFGGDPAHVLMYGQSAGAADVQALLVSPATQGLFSAAATDSGLLLHGNALPLATIEALDQPFVSTVGCASTTDVLACLRAVPAETIVSNQGPYSNNSLMIEPRVIPIDPFDALQQHGSPVPYLTGGTREEFATLGDDPNAQLDANGYVAALHSRFDSYGATVATQVMALYPETDYGSYAYALIAVDSDFNGACLERTVARAASGATRPPVWRFLYTHQFESDASLAAYRAFHTAELYFVFGNVQTATTAPPYTPTQAELAFAGQMMGYWSRFAATGNPNDPNGAALWPPYDPSTDAMLQLDDVQTPIDGYHNSRCDYFAALPAPQNGTGPARGTTPLSNNALGGDHRMGD